MTNSTEKEIAIISNEIGELKIKLYLIRCELIVAPVFIKEALIIEQGRIETDIRLKENRVQNLKKGYFKIF